MSAGTSNEGDRSSRKSSASSEHGIDLLAPAQSSPTRVGMELVCASLSTNSLFATRGGAISHKNAQTPAAETSLWVTAATFGPLSPLNHPFRLVESVLSAEVKFPILDRDVRRRRNTVLARFESAGR